MFPKISLPSIPDEVENKLSSNAVEVLPEEIYSESIQRTGGKSKKNRLFIRFNTTPVKQIEALKDEVLPELEFNQA